METLNWVKIGLIYAGCTLEGIYMLKVINKNIRLVWSRSGTIKVNRRHSGAFIVNVEFIFQYNIQLINLFQSTVTFYIETSHLICIANQMTGFYMKCNTGMKWVNLVITVNTFFRSGAWNDHPNGDNSL